MGHGNNIGYTDNHESNLNVHQNLQNNSIGSRSAVERSAEIPNNGPLKADSSFQHTDQSLLSEKEIDVPYFSDVEAMILEMDLSPDEFDISTYPEVHRYGHEKVKRTIIRLEQAADAFTKRIFAGQGAFAVLYGLKQQILEMDLSPYDFDLSTYPEVQRYRHEKVKRTIIRLEQAADAFTKRIFAGQGAFAVLYGRCSKYIIKKPEVLLGRATDDIKVDIDLGREKSGRKISRRQATMKMDMHGIFHLKNLGKTPMYMNGKEVAPGQSLCLVSDCLIVSEVRGLTFGFVTNPKMIK